MSSPHPPSPSPRQRAFVFALAAVVLLVPGTAGAQPAGSLLRQGIDELEGGQFERSLETLKRASAATEDAGELGQIYLHQGLAHGILGRDDAARTAFATALAFDPELQVDAERFKKQVVDLFREVLAGLKAELLVTADVPDAAVAIDGTPLGRVPLRRRIPIGAHHVKVQAGDAKRGCARRIVAHPRRRIELRARLAARAAPRCTSVAADAGGEAPGPRGELAVNADRTPALVLLDGKQVGRVPFWAQLPPGLYRLEVRSLDGQMRFDRRLTVKPGHKTRVQARLVRRAAPAPAPEPAPPTPRPRRRLWTWVAAGAAVAVAGTALGLGLAARSDHDAYGEVLAQWHASDTDEQRADLEVELDGLERGASRKALAANVLFGVAGALAATAAALFVLEGRSKPERARLAATRGGIALGVTF